jgi:hypothetical protein
MQSTAMRVALRISYSVTILATAFPLYLAAQTAQPAGKHTETAPAQTAITRETLAGTYDGGQMEVASELHLKPDGHFQYGLAYGALDEEAEGTWEFKDGMVLLTTVPAVKPPQFVVESDKPDPRGGLWIKLSSGPVIQGARQRIYLVYGPGEEPGMVEIADDGHVPFPENRRPTAIIPEIPVYPVTSKPIPLTGTEGHNIVMRFEPNDIGKADFRAQRLTIENGVLVMPRRDLQLMLHFKPRSQKDE